MWQSIVSSKNITRYCFVLFLRYFTFCSPPVDKMNPRRSTKMISFFCLWGNILSSVHHSRAIYHTSTFVIIMIIKDDGVWRGALFRFSFDESIYQTGLRRSYLTSREKKIFKWLWVQFGIHKPKLSCQRRIKLHDRVGWVQSVQSI